MMSADWASPGFGVTGTLELTYILELQSKWPWVFVSGVSSRQEEASEIEYHSRFLEYKKLSFCLPEVFKRVHHQIFKFSLAVCWERPYHPPTCFNPLLALWLGFLPAGLLGGWTFTCAKVCCQSYFAVTSILSYCHSYCPQILCFALSKASVSSFLDNNQPQRLMSA
jgi:hypothetical protein